jgi:NAD(P)H-hydrate epimerase
MEHAAQSVRRVSDHLRRQHGLRRVLVVCGPGNNGGDGYALARLHAIDGIDTHIVAFGSPREGTDAAINAAICRAMDIPISGEDSLRELLDHPSLIVDALFGTGLERPLGEDAKAIVAQLNAADSPILSIDIPSGLDVDTGRPRGTSIRADCTVTMVALKPAMLEVGSERYLGEVVVSSIGTPECLLKEFARVVPSPEADVETKPPPPPDRRGP